MTLANYRHVSDKIVIPIAKKLLWANPDSISWLALITATLTGFLFYMGEPILLLVAALFVLLSGFLDVLDGVIARLAKKDSIRGDFLDHVLDRYADIFIIGGLMLSPFVRDIFGFLAIIGVLLTSYMGTQAMAVTGKRDYGGHLGRATRLAVLIFVPIIQYFWLYTGLVLPYGLNVLELAMIYFAVVGNLTALQRAYKTWRRL